MAIPGLGDLVEVACVHRFGLVDEQINIWHIHVAVAGTGDEGDVDDDLIEFFSGLYSTIASQISTVVSAYEIRWRNLTDDTATRFVPWVDAYTGGTNSSDALPPGTTALMLLRTGVKNVQGRKYLPTFGESQQNSGAWGSTALTNMNTMGAIIEAQNQLLSTGIEFTFHVNSRTQGNDFPVTAAQPRLNVAYQKRRREGRGS